jgi:hypothetical protein
MGARKGWTAMAAAAMLAGCGAEAHEPRATPVESVRAPAEAPAPPAPMLAADSAAARARIDAAAAALRVAFARTPVLTAREVAELRLDVNATQLRSAERLGTRVSGEGHRSRLAREGRLVELPDSTDWWILRRMDHSAPYATPEAVAMLEALGRRFHARLDAAGLPRYRMRVTSALRTAEEQAALRRVNANAAWTASAHEFGTTVDVSHERFAVPAGSWEAAGSPRLPEAETEALETVGKEHSRVLQAELGRAIQALRGEGALHVMMEDAQPVYHMTVARALPPREGGRQGRSSARR